MFLVRNYDITMYLVFKRSSAGRSSILIPKFSEL